VGDHPLVIGQSLPEPPLPSQGHPHIKESLVIIGTIPQGLVKIMVRFPITLLPGKGRPEVIVGQPVLFVNGDGMAEQVLGVSPITHLKEGNQGKDEDQCRPQGRHGRR